MKVIHETVIKDIVELIGDLKDVKSIQDLVKRNKKGSNMKSIAQASAALNLVYPCIISDSISIESAAMVSKANERKNAQMLQLLFAAWQSSKLDPGEQFNPIEYLRQYHRNLNIDCDVSVDSVLDTVDKVVKIAESAGMLTNTVESISEDMMIDIIKESTTPDTTLPDTINPISVIDYKVRRNKTFGGTLIVQERTNWSNGVGYADDNDFISSFAKGGNPNGRPTTAKYTQNTTTNTYNGPNGSVQYRTTTTSSDTYEMDSDEELVNFAKNKADALNSIEKLSQSKRTSNSRPYGTKDVTDADLRQQEFHNKQEENRRKNEKHRNDEKFRKYSELNTKQQISTGVMPQLMNVDVKKANELVGTPMMVTVHVVNPEGGIDPITFLIAVKSKMYPVSSKDIINRIIAKNKDKNFFSKLIKVATGEISFVRDFLFAIDGAKLDALSQSKKGSSSKLWRVLERTALKSKITRTLGKNNDYMAITTLVISQEEVEYIKKYANIDMEKEANGRLILEAYNLLCLVIVDQTNETAKFLYNSGNDLYEELSFNQLEREATDGSYKKMVNLISKMR